MSTRHITVVVRSTQGCGCKIGHESTATPTAQRPKPPPKTNSAVFTLNALVYACFASCKAVFSPVFLPSRRVTKTWFRVLLQL